jgi:hypothetical protein
MEREGLRGLTGSAGTGRLDRGTESNMQEIPREQTFLAEPISDARGMVGDSLRRANDSESEAIRGDYRTLLDGLG